MLKSENYLTQDRALHADMLAALAEQRAEVCHDTEDTLLLRETNSGVYLLASRTADSTERILRDLYEKSACVVLHGAMMDVIAEQLGYGMSRPCRQVLYEQPPLELRGELTVRHPAEADFPTVRENYAMSDDEELFEDFSKPDFIGGYLDGKMVGFIGLHCEGSMGMLAVLPEYRRRGYAEQIYSVLINNQLQKGRLPYAQVFTDNTGSLNLQRKLGFTFSKDTIIWVWVPKQEE